MLQTIAHQAVVLTETRLSLDELSRLFADLGDVAVVDAVATPHPAGTRDRSVVVAAACGTNLVVEVTPRRFRDATGALARACEHATRLDEAADPIGRHAALVKIRATAVAVDPADAGSIALHAAELARTAAVRLATHGGLAWFVPAGEVVAGLDEVAAAPDDAATTASFFVGLRSWRDAASGQLVADTVGAEAFGVTDVEASFAAPATTVDAARGYVWDAFAERLGSAPGVAADTPPARTAVAAPARRVEPHVVA